VTFSVKQRVAELSLEPFPFEALDGTTHELPHIGLMSAGQAGAVLDAIQIDSVAGFRLLLIDEQAPAAERKKREAALAALLATPLPIFVELGAAWMDHCNVGELLASSSSSKPTPRPSKQTLPASSGRKRRS